MQFRFVILSVLVGMCALTAASDATARPRHHRYSAPELTLAGAGAAIVLVVGASAVLAGRKRRRRG